MKPGCWVFSSFILSNPPVIAHVPAKILTYINWSSFSFNQSTHRLCAKKNNYWRTQRSFGKLCRRTFEAASYIASTGNQSVIWDFVWNWNPIENNPNGFFFRKYIKIEIKFKKTLPVVCLLWFYRYSKLLEVVLGDFLLNGRCDGMSLAQYVTCRRIDRLYCRKLPKTASRSSAKR